MTDFRKIDNSTEVLFEKTLQKVQDQFSVSRKDSTVGLKLLEKFDEVKKYESLFVHKVTELKGSTGSFIILLVEKHLTIIEQKRNVRVEKEVEEVEPMLIFSVPQDIGKVYIRKETWADKIADLFNKVDIDFKEYPDFSKNYYVMSEKPDQVRDFLPKGLLESLEKIQNMTIEINGNWGLVRPEKNLTEKVLLLLLSIGYKMTKL